MKVTQAHTILNTVINPMQLGETAIVKEDLSNLVDVGRAVFNYFDGTQNGLENFCKSLIDQVGKVVFVNRVLRSQAPNIMKDSWEYGSILEKVRCELPDAQANETWNINAHGTATPKTYPNPFEIYIPEVEAVFYNEMDTYEVPITLAEIQVREAFRGASEMMRFFNMIENRVATKKTLCNDGLIMGTILNLIAQKIGYGENVIDLLDLWNTVGGGSGSDTKADAVVNPAFWQFVSITLGRYKKYLAGASSKYNHGDYVTFTPEDKLKFIMLTDYAKCLETYLYSGTYHDDYVKIKGFEEVGFWQGTGTTDEQRDHIWVETKIDADSDGEIDDKVVVEGDIMAVMFDEEAAAVCCENDRVQAAFNPRGEYTTYYYKWDARYMNDIVENCVIFTIGGGYQVIGAAGTLANDTALTTKWPSWNTTYAVDNSGYYMYDVDNNTYYELSAADQTTAATFDLTKISGHTLVLKK